MLVMTDGPDTSLAAAWDLWRESSCLERGGHFWAGAKGSARTRACQCCPVMRRRCDVCRGEFLTSDDQQLRCSDACREFARQHKLVPSSQLRVLWEQEQRRIRTCPSGKVRHQWRGDAVAAARSAEHLRFSGFSRWLRVYECDLCDGWHLTSKPKGRRLPGRNPAA